jgi:precorrin-6x reductase
VVVFTIFVMVRSCAVKVLRVFGVRRFVACRRSEARREELFVAQPRGGVLRNERVLAIANRASELVTRSPGSKGIAYHKMRVVLRVGIVKVTLTIRCVK